MKIPNPKELLVEFQKIDPSIIMSTVPSIGITYGSMAGKYGFSIGIDGETGKLRASVSNQNIYVDNEYSELMTLPELMDWMRDGNARWHQIPVEGRIGNRLDQTELEKLEQAEIDAEDNGMAISQQVKDLESRRDVQVIEI